MTALPTTALTDLTSTDLTTHGITFTAWALLAARCDDLADTESTSMGAR